MAIELGVIFKATDQVSQTVNHVRRALGYLDRDVAKIESNFGKMVGVTAGGLGMMGAGLKLMQMPVSFVKDAGAVSDKMLRIQANSDLSGAAIEQLRSNFMRISAILPESALEMADVGIIAAQMGMASDKLAKTGVANITSFVETILKATKVMPELTPEFAAAEFSQLKTFLNDTTVSYKDLASAITAANKNSIASGKDLLTSANRFASVGSQFGLTTAQIITLSALTKEAALGGKTGGSAYLRTINSMVTRTDKWAQTLGMTKQAYEKLIMSNGGKGFEQALTALGKLDKIKFGQALKDLALSGVQTAPMISSVSKQIGSRYKELMDIITRALKGNGKVLDDAFKLQSSSLPKRLDVLKGEIENFRAALGHPLEPVAVRFVDFVSSSIDGALKVIDNRKPAAQRMVKSLFDVGKHLFVAGGAATLVGGSLAAWAVARTLATRQAAKIAAATGAALRPVTNRGVLAFLGGGLLQTGGFLLKRVLLPVALLTAAAEGLSVAWEKNFMNIRGITLKASKDLPGAIEGLTRIMFDPTSFTPEFRKGLKGNMFAGALDFASEGMRVAKDFGTGFSEGMDMLNIGVDLTQTFQTTGDIAKDVFAIIGNAALGAVNVMKSFGVLPETFDTNNVKTYGQAIGVAVAGGVKVALTALNILLSTLEKLLGIAVKISNTMAHLADVKDGSAGLTALTKNFGLGRGLDLSREDLTSDMLGKLPDLNMSVDTKMKGVDIKAEMTELRELMKTIDMPKGPVVSIEGFADGVRLAHNNYDDLAQALADTPEITFGTGNSTQQLLVFKDTVHSVMSDIAASGMAGGGLGASLGSQMTQGLTIAFMGVQGAIQGNVGMIASTLVTGLADAGNQGGASLVTNIAPHALAAQQAVLSPMGNVPATLGGIGLAAGLNMGAQMAAGIRQKIPEVAAASNALAAAASGPVKGKSPPRMGPLKTIFKDGANIATQFAKGFAKAAPSMIHSMQRDLRPSGEVIRTAVALDPNATKALQRRERPSQPVIVPMPSSGGSDKPQVIQLVLDGRVLSEYNSSQSADFARRSFAV